MEGAKRLPRLLGRGKPKTTPQLQGKRGVMVMVMVLLVGTSVIRRWR